MSEYIVSVTRFIWSSLTSLFHQKDDGDSEQPDVMRRMVLAGAVATVVVGLVGATMFASPAQAQHYRRRSRRWRRRRRHLYRRSRRRHSYRRSRPRYHSYRRSRRRHSYRRSRRRHSYRRSRRRHSYRRSRWY